MNQQDSPESGISTPRCFYCDIDLTPKLASLRLPAIHTSDMSDDNEVIKKLKVCCEKHDEIDEAARRVLATLRSCPVSHVFCEPVERGIWELCDHERTRSLDQLEFYYRSSRMEMQYKKTAKLMKLSNWLVCLRDHADFDFDGSHLRREIKSRLEVCAIQAVDDDCKDPLESVLLCARDHRMRCVCRAPINPWMYEEYLSSRLQSMRSSFGVNRQLFGSSRPSVREEAERVDYGLLLSSASVPTLEPYERQEGESPQVATMRESSEKVLSGQSTTQSDSVVQAQF